MVTKFKHPPQEYDVSVILDPCHMLKLARNALASLSPFTDSNGDKVKWTFFQNSSALQEEDFKLKLANKLSAKHLQFEKHKMNVRLAAQTLSSSVANAIEFLDISMKRPDFQDSQGTVNFTRTIDRLFDMLNSRNPLGKGYKQPLRLKSKSIWESIVISTADYLLILKTDAVPPQFLSTHQRKTFVVGFVATIKSTIEMANEMLSSSDNPFNYLLIYKYSHAYTIKRWLEQQPLQLAAEICYAEDAFKKCCYSFKKCKLHRPPPRRLRSSPISITGSTSHH